MSLADTLNPFLFRERRPGVRDPNSQSYLEAPTTVIQAAIDEVILSGVDRLERYAFKIPPEDDFEVYGLDVTLASDLIQRGRDVTIYCRKLTILAGDEPTVIDVSPEPEERYAQARIPDFAYDSPEPGAASSGAEILAALKEGDYKRWFSDDPGRGWGDAGASAGSITIGCETIVFAGKLKLLANGARGNAGVHGQSRNYLAGAVGGDAGSGGRGGDGGAIRIDYYRAVDADGERVDIDEWLVVEAAPGEHGEHGQPGDAFDAERSAHHYGDRARPVEAATGGKEDVDDVAEFELESSTAANKTVVVPDLSEVALGMPLRYLRLLFHRAKLTYLHNQPVTFGAPFSPGWTKELNEVLGWAYRLTLGLALPNLSPAADFDTDPESDGKRTIASSLNVVHSWYEHGQLIWGHSQKYVSPLPFAVQAKLLEKGYEAQRDVRDVYIALRRELEKAELSQEKLNATRAGAAHAVALHKLTYEALRDVLFIDGRAGPCLQTQLLAATQATHAACEALKAKLEVFKVAGKKLWNFSMADLLDGMQSMMFVLGDPPALAGMGLLEGAKLYDNTFNKIKTNDGVNVSKGKLDKIDQFKGELSELAAIAVPIGSDLDRRANEVVLATLKNVDDFVSNFTDALGDVAEKVLSDVADYREKIGVKSDLLLTFNTQLRQMAREYEEYQAAREQQVALDQKPDELSKNMVDTVMHYTGVYLANLEKTAEAMAWLRQKYAYVTLGGVADGDYLANASQFWDDPGENPELADASLSDEFVKVQGYASKLAQYEANQADILEVEPETDGPAGKRSVYCVLLRGDDEQQRPILEELLNDGSVTVTAVPAADVKMPPGTVANPVRVSDDGAIWDARVLNVMPWLEGVTSDSGRVHFRIRTGARGVILDSKRGAWQFEYPGGVVTDFAHEATATVNEPNNRKMAGAGRGLVANEFIGSRGLYTTYTLYLADAHEADSNHGLTAADIKRVKLQICFRMTLRNRV